MFVSIIHLRIKYFIVFVFYLWYLFVASAFVRMVQFFILSFPWSDALFFLNTIYLCDFTPR